MRSSRRPWVQDYCMGPDLGIIYVLDGQCSIREQSRDGVGALRSRWRASVMRQLLTTRGAGTKRVGDPVTAQDDKGGSPSKIQDERGGRKAGESKTGAREKNAGRKARGYGSEFRTFPRFDRLASTPPRPFSNRRCCAGRQYPPPTRS